MNKNRAEEGLSSLEALAKQTVENSLKELHTVLPGIIDSFDPATQTCTVQPAIKRKFKDGEELKLPLLINVPVCFPTTKRFSITFPIKKGDDCLLMFCERSLDNWLKFAEIRSPNDKRFHDLSDGIALMGLRDKPGALANYDPENFVIRNEDNDAKITIGNNKNITIDTPTDVIVNAGGVVDVNATGNVTVDTDANIEAIAGGEAKITSTGNTTITAPTVAIVGNLTVSGSIAAVGIMTTQGSLTAIGEVTGKGKSLSTHTHPYTWTDPGGSGNTGSAN